MSVKPTMSKKVASSNSRTVRSLSLLMLLALVLATGMALTGCKPKEKKVAPATQSTSPGTSGTSDKK